MSLAVFVQVIDPDAFGGRAAFARRAGFVADACRAVPPAPGVSSVRVPGDGAARSRRAGLEEGVLVDAAVLDALAARAARLGIGWPFDAARGAVNPDARTPVRGMALPRRRA